MIAQWLRSHRYPEPVFPGVFIRGIGAGILNVLTFTGSSLILQHGILEICS